MYPLPTLVSGKKQELISNYKRQVNGLENKPFYKLKGSKRIMLYNVNCFNFAIGNPRGTHANDNIANLARELKVDTIAICEYSDILAEEVDKMYENQVYYKQYYSFGIAALSKHSIIDYNVLELDPQSCKEMRGAIHFNQYGLNIILTHLDVWDETGRLRKLEMGKIIEYVEQSNLENVILLGDFNEASIDKTLLGESIVEDLNISYKERTGIDKPVPNQVHDLLKKNNYIDIFDFLGRSIANKPKFSCWSGRLVDYCYIYMPTWKDNVKIKNADFYFTTYSDHLPMVIDLVANDKD